MTTTATVDTARLTAVISPLRRTLLATARAQENLPDLPDAQVEVIRALPRDAVVSPGALAAELGLSRPAISNLLAAMERSGLVERRQRPDDRRRVEVRATERALDIFDRFDTTSARITADAVDRLSADDQRALAGALPALERLRDALAEQRRHEEARGASL